MTGVLVFRNRYEGSSKLHLSIRCSTILNNLNRCSLFCNQQWIHHGKFIGRVLNFGLTELIAQTATAVELACNLVITSSTSYYLWKAKSAVRTQRIINFLSRLIVLSIETSLACAITSTVALALFYVSGNTSFFALPLFLLGKLYSNSLLAVRSSIFLYTSISERPVRIGTQFSDSSRGWS